MSGQPRNSCPLDASGQLADKQRSGLGSIYRKYAPANDLGERTICPPAGGTTKFPPADRQPPLFRGGCPLSGVRRVEEGR